MGITIKYTPQIYSSVHDDLIYTVAEPVKTADPVTYPNYKFIADVYVGGALVARIRNVPNPSTGIGIFNIGQIVRNYMATDFNPTPGALIAQELGETDFWLQAIVIFGEEYNFTSYYNLRTDLPPRIYFNNYNTRQIGYAGSRPYSTAAGIRGEYYNTINLEAGGPIVLERIDLNVDFAFPGSPGAGVNADHYSVRWTGQVLAQYSETYTFYTQSADGVRLYINGVLLINNWTDHASTEDSATMDLIAGDLYDIRVEYYRKTDTSIIKVLWSSASLAFEVIPAVSLIYATMSTDSTSSLSPKADKVASNRPPAIDVLLNSQYMFIPYFPTTTGLITLSVTPVGGGSAFATSFNPTNAFDMQVFNLSPGALNALHAGAINASTTSYTVSINGQPYRFNLICEAIFSPYTIHFLNQYGGFESKIFTKVSRNSFDIVRTDFGKLKYTVDVNGQPSFKSSNNVFNETRSTYASQINEKLALNSDNLTDAEYTWLKELLVSPMIYMEDGGNFYPCVITDTTYEPKKYVNDDLTNLTINMEFGNQLNAQYR